MKIDKTQLAVTVVVAFLTGLLGSHVGNRSFQNPSSVPAIGFGVAAGPAPAGETSVDPACADDSRKFGCDGAPLAEGSMLGCLLEFDDQVSASCRKILAPILQRYAACEKEIRTFCPDVKKGRMRIPNCLKSHSTKLSAACASSLGL